MVVVTYVRYDDDFSNRSTDRLILTSTVSRHDLRPEFQTALTTLLAILNTSETGIR